MGAGFWAGMFLISRKVLRYFQRAEDIGALLSYKLLSVVLITCFSLLLFSYPRTILFSQIFLTQMTSCSKK
jgi:ABC-2 type transport system permease protein